MIARFRSIFDFISELYEKMTRRNISLLSAGIAFFTLLAVFPGLAALISVIGFFADPLIIQDQLQLLEDLIPPAAFALLRSQVTRMVWANDGALGWTTVLSLLVAVFLARRGVAAILNGLGAIHGTARRSGFAQALRVFAVTLGMLVTGVVALLSVLVLPIVTALVPVPAASGWLIEGGRWGLTFGMLCLWIWVSYRVGPNRTKGARIVIWPGLALAMLIWMAASYGFSYYLSNFGNYNEIYGSIGAVVALLMWFYLSAYAVLLGGVLNAALETSDQDVGP